MKKIVVVLFKLRSALTKVTTTDSVGEASLLRDIKITPFFPEKNQIDKWYCLSWTKAYCIGSQESHEKKDTLASLELELYIQKIKITRYFPILLYRNAWTTLVQKDLIIFENYKDCSNDGSIFFSHQTLVFPFWPLCPFLALKTAAHLTLRQIVLNLCWSHSKKKKKRKKKIEIFVIKSLLICKW